MGKMHGKGESGWGPAWQLLAPVSELPTIRQIMALVDSWAIRTGFRPAKDYSSGNSRGGNYNFVLQWQKMTS
jgi:hypothetical protein